MSTHVAVANFLFWGECNECSAVDEDVLHRGKTPSHHRVQGIGLYTELATSCVLSLCNPSSIPHFVFSFPGSWSDFARKHIWKKIQRLSFLVGRFSEDHTGMSFQIWIWAVKYFTEIKFLIHSYHHMLLYLSLCVRMDLVQHIHRYACQRTGVGWRTKMEKLDMTAWSNRKLVTSSQKAPSS